MWLKKKKVNVLEKSVESLSHTLQEGNYIEWAYLLGSKKEIIKRPRKTAAKVTGAESRERANSRDSIPERG